MQSRVGSLGKQEAEQKTLLSAVRGALQAAEVEARANPSSTNVGKYQRCKRECEEALNTAAVRASSGMLAESQAQLQGEIDVLHGHLEKVEAQAEESSPNCFSAKTSARGLQSQIAIKEAALQELGATPIDPSSPAVVAEKDLAAAKRHHGNVRSIHRNPRSEHEKKLWADSEASLREAKAAVDSAPRVLDRQSQIDDVRKQMHAESDAARKGELYDQWRELYEQEKAASDA